MRRLQVGAAALWDLAVVFGILAVPSLGLATEGNLKSERDRFQGKWLQHAQVFAQGRFLVRGDNGDITTEFNGDKFVDFNGTMVIGRGKFMLDPSKRPREIDLVYEVSPPGPQRPPGEKESPMVLKGIYELDGDELRVCFGFDQRPKRIAAKGDDFIIEFKRRGK
jgi:uncharacterized protein (TIGR03067 family)